MYVHKVKGGDEMLILKNPTKGPRGIMMKSGQHEFLMPGEQKTFEADDVVSYPGDLIEGEGKREAEAPAADKFDHDGDGEPGGSLPDAPPSLSAMTRAELELELEAEGIDIDEIPGTGKNDAVVMADIMGAIEAKRAEAKPAE